MRAVSLFSLDLWPEAFSASLSGSCCAYKHLISGLGVVTFVLASGVMFGFATSWPLRNAG